MPEQPPSAVPSSEVRRLALQDRQTETPPNIAATNHENSKQTKSCDSKLRIAIPARLKFTRLSPHPNSTCETERLHAPLSPPPSSPGSDRRATQDANQNVERLRTAEPIRLSSRTLAFGTKLYVLLCLYFPDYIARIDPINLAIAVPENSQVFCAPCFRLRAKTYSKEVSCASSPLTPGHYSAY
jgi:hypothetical protein